MFLTAAETIELTGYRQGSRQCAWFDKNRIPYKVALSGRPLVREFDLLGEAAKARVLDREYEAAMAASPPIPALDRDAAYRPIAEIRARRARWKIGCGPDGSGIYFLFLRWALVYIGQSVRVHARLRAHRMNMFDQKSRLIPFTGWSAIEVPEYWLDEVEMFYIQREQPAFNIRGVRRD